MSYKQETIEINMSAMTEAYGLTDLCLMMAEAAEEDRGLPFAAVLVAVDRASDAAHGGRFDAGTFFDTLTEVIGAHNGNRRVLVWPDADKD